MDWIPITFIVVLKTYMPKKFLCSVVSEPLRWLLLKLLYQWYAKLGVLEDWLVDFCDSSQHPVSHIWWPACCVDLISWEHQPFMGLDGSSPRWYTSWDSSGKSTFCSYCVSFSVIFQQTKKVASFPSFVAGKWLQIWSLRRQLHFM